jgi:DNA invertase Pin-like site-specific DNA recombinase
MKRNVVLYVRVSTDKQDYNRQISSLKITCKNNDYEIIKTFEEKISGIKSQKERPALNDLMEFVKDKSKKIEKVVIQEISRLGRSTTEVKNTIEKLNEEKISVYISTINMETLDVDGKPNQYAGFIFTILSELAQMERETIIFRSRDGLLESAKKGNAGGGIMIPYGYKRDKDKKLVIDEEESKLIQRIYGLSLQGKGTRVIAEILNSEHIQTRGNKSFTKRVKLPNGIMKAPGEFEWAGNTILSILRNPIYKGERKYKGKLLTDPIIVKSPVIIDLEIWDKVQNQLIINRNDNPRNTRHDYILRKKLICGFCGRYYTGKKRTSLKDNFYQCSSKLYPRHKCRNKGISIVKIENVIWSILRTGNKDFQTNLIIKSTIDNTDSINELTINKARLEKEKKSVEASLGRTFELFATTESMSIDIVKNLEKKYQNKLKRITKDLSRIDSQIFLLKVQSEKSASVEKLLEKLYEIEENFSLAKEIINEVVEKCIIFNLIKEDTALLTEYLEIRNDEFFYLKVFTYNSIIPIKVIISRMSDNIHYLTDKIQYNDENRSLIVKDSFLLNSLHTLPISRINRDKVK